MRPPTLQIFVFPVLLLVTKVRHIVAPSPRGGAARLGPTTLLARVRRLAFKCIPATVPEETQRWAMGLRAASTQPTRGPGTHRARWGVVVAAVEAGKALVVFLAVLVVTEHGVRRVYGNESLGGVWVIEVAVGVVDFA